ncbi:ABC transporter permease [Gemmatimonadota bacterium]
MNNLLNDLRYTFRSMKLNPGFVAVAVFSLAIGIGVNTGLFSIYKTIFRPDQGVEDGHELVVLAGNDIDDFLGSYPEYLDYREQTTDTFEDLLAYIPMIALMDLGESSDMIFFEEVTGNYFDLLGVDPVLGRTFIEEEDDTPGAVPTLVLSHITWQNKFGADPDIIGRSVMMNSHAFTVIGVAPPDFPGMFPFTVACWTPINTHDLLEQGGNGLNQRADESDCYIKGRLKDGVTIGRAREVMWTVRNRLAQEYPDIYEGQMTGEIVLPAKDIVIVPEFDRPIKLLSWFLMGLVGLVLVIACTNLASILLARASARQKEIGIRLAIGAGRGRLIRQLLTESITLSLMGGLVGVGIAQGLIKLLLAVRPPLPLDVNLDFGLSGAALLFTLVLSVLTGIVFGLIPARQATNPDIVHSLKGTATTFHGRRRFGLKNSLIVAQVAVSVILLLCAGLLLRSLGNATSVDPGFDLDRGVLFDFMFEFTEYEESRARSFVNDVKERIASLPGVERVGMADLIPLNLSSRGNRVIPIDSDYQVGENGVHSFRADATPGYFAAMGIPVLRGRTFDDTDVQGVPDVAIVNETFAGRFWPGEDPIGKQFRTTYGERIYTIVGVAADGKYRTLGEDQSAFFYGALLQRPISGNTVSFIVRTSAPESGLIPLIQQEVRALDPDMPLFDLKTVPAYKGVMLFIPRLVGSIASALGLVALILGSIGLYGIIAFEVSRRTREVGVRMALGAQKRDVLNMVLWSGLKLVLVGLLIGVPVAALAARGLTALLFGIDPLDPITFAGIPLILIGVTIAATMTPARRAARINPIDALHHE